jgi:hypothetical protein
MDGEQELGRLTPKRSLVQSQYRPPNWYPYLHYLNRPRCSLFRQYFSLKLLCLYSHLCNCNSQHLETPTGYLMVEKAMRRDARLMAFVVGGIHLDR